MTITNQIKILNKKSMQNEAQYDLDGKAAKISVLSSNNLDRYEHLTGEYLGLKSSTIEQGRFENSPLGKIFNKGLDKDDPLSSNSESFTYKTSKNKGQLKLLSNANKTSSYKENESDYNYDNNFAFLQVLQRLLKL